MPFRDRLFSSHFSRLLLPSSLAACTTAFLVHSLDAPESTSTSCSSSRSSTPPFGNRVNCDNTSIDSSNTLARSIHSPNSSKSKIVFLGTGSSTGCPRPICPLVFSHTAPHLHELQNQLEDQCRTSLMASQSDPRRNKNYRNNPSLLIAYQASDEAPPQHIVIDTGKTFREAAIRWMPLHRITSLDAVVLTHEHADASFGLDDVRGFQKYEANRTMIPMPLYLSRDCFNCLSRSFPWLLPARKNEDDSLSTPPNNMGRNVTTIPVRRHVASFDVNILEAFQPFRVGHEKGLEMVPLPVMHGEDLIAYGYSFRLGSKNIVYLSDISRILPETLEFLQSMPSIEILIVDCLHPGSNHITHFTLSQALDLIGSLQPAKAYLVGMNCDSFPPHDETNEDLAKLPGVDVQLAHDGLMIECD